MIEVSNVSYGYKPGKNVLQNIALTIKEGTWLTVLGENGSGKTTLAMLLNGLLLPSKGTVTIDDMMTSQKEKLPRIRQRVGYVFQNPDNQILGATVEEDVAFGPCNLGLPRHEVMARVDKALTIMALEQYRYHSPHMLSGGEKQKVALAGILAMEPKYLLLDEACSMLDPLSRENFWREINKLHQELALTVINISHFPEEALLGDGIILLKQGKLEAQLWL